MRYKTLKEIRHLNGHIIYLLEMTDRNMYMLLHVYADEIKESRCYSFLTEKSRKLILQSARKEFKKWKEASYKESLFFGEPT